MPRTKSATVESARAGLSSSSAPIPLEGVSIAADLNDFSARVVVTQRYRNIEDRAIEAVYTFPLDEQAAVCGFEAIVGGVHYAGEVQARDAAFRKYDDALQAGHGAFLLDEERPDVFVASVGNIPPGGEALLKITYVTELVVEGEAVRFTLPTTVAPRYAPMEDRTGVGRSAAETLNPRAEWSVPYGLDLNLRIAMPGAITRLQSPSHPMSIEIDGARATVTLAQANAALDRDVVLLVEAKDLFESHVRVERDQQGQLTAALAVRPVFDSAVAPAEVIFVVDRSGSMQGSSIAEVRNALQLCLRSLVPGCGFNIVGFGSTHTALFDASRAYDDASLAAASAHVQSLEADLGGTEILGALKFAFAQPAAPGLPRNVVVLTDGEVTNTDAVMAEIALHADARVFSFGIGRGASAHLVRGLARAGRGLAEFIYPGERIEPKVLRQFSRLLSPAIGDVSVRWGDLDATPVCTDLPPVFAGERLVTYAFLTEVHPVTVAVSARGPHGDVEFQAPIRTADVAAGRTLAILAARRRIRELEEHPESLRQLGSRQTARTTDRIRDEIIRLSTTYGIVSRHTSFVAIEHREGAVATELTLRRIPIALTSGWGRLDEASRALNTMSAVPAPMAQMGSSVALEIADQLADSVEPRRMKLGARIANLMRPSAKRPLDAVIELQRANGSWELTRDLAARLSIEFHPLQSGRPSAIAPDAWATLVALAWLGENASDEQNEWSSLARKAETWLTLNVPAAALASGRAAARALATA